MLYLSVTYPLAVLGGLEVSERGDLSNWMIPGKMIKGMGGAMELVKGAKGIVVVMVHVNKNEESKIKKECTLPLTGRQVVSRLITDLAVFDFTPEGMVLIETEEGVTVEEVRTKTEASFTVSENKVIKLSPYLVTYPTRSKYSKA